MAGTAAAEIPALRKVRRPDRMSPIILQIRERRAITSTLIPMTLPAFSITVEFFTAGDALRARRYLCRECEGGRCFILEFLREGLDILDYLSPIAFREHIPAGHRAARKTVGDGTEEIIIRRHGTAGSRADFVDASREIARLWKDFHGRRPGALPIITVTLGTFASVDLLARLEVLRRRGCPLFLRQGCGGQCQADPHTPQYGCPALSCRSPYPPP